MYHRTIMYPAAKLVKVEAVSVENKITKTNSILESFRAYFPK